MGNFVTALLKERQGYLNDGNVEGVKAVDLQLRKYGFVVSDEVEEAAVAPPQTERAVKPKSVKRIK